MAHLNYQGYEMIYFISSNWLMSFVPYCLSVLLVVTV